MYHFIFITIKSKFNLILSSTSIVLQYCKNNKIYLNFKYALRQTVNRPYRPPDGAAVAIVCRWGNSSVRVVIVCCYFFIIFSALSVCLSRQWTVMASTVSYHWRPRSVVCVHARVCVCVCVWQNISCERREK